VYISTLLLLYALLVSTNSQVACTLSHYCTLGEAVLHMAVTELHHTLSRTAATAAVAVTTAAVTATAVIVTTAVTVTTTTTVTTVLTAHKIVCRSTGSC
jgi:hypothetical protein